LFRQNFSERSIRTVVDSARQDVAIGGGVFIRPRESNLLCALHNGGQEDKRFLEFAFSRIIAIAIAVAATVHVTIAVPVPVPATIAIAIAVAVTITITITIAENFFTYAAYADGRGFRTLRAHIAWNGLRGRNKRTTCDRHHGNPSD